MHPHHETLLAEIQSGQRKGRDAFGASYLKSGHRYYGLTAPVLRGIARQWVRANKDTPPGEVVRLLESLFTGESLEEKVLAALLLGYSKQMRAAVSTKNLDAWLDHLVGWAEIDSLCSNIFKPDEALAKWKDWERLLKRLARDKNINKRRAALVFLTGFVRYSDDERLSALAFDTVERLKEEREIIITKAVSWLLRNLTSHHKKAVAAYIAKNRASLPAIAVRETTRKIKTGRK
jgi:3-methyladenine DNA glycosylase AlkD